MRAHAADTRVVHYPVETGSETTVPIFMAVSAPPDSEAQDAPKILWPVGFGEGKASAVEVAERLRAATGLLAVGIRLPFAETVKKASNVGQGLDHMVKGALAFAGTKVGRFRPSYYGGNSLGGAVSAIASAEDEPGALGVLSPLIANRALGRTMLTRRSTVVWRLGVRTLIQNRRLGQAGMGDVAQGARNDFQHMGLRRFMEATGYTFSDRTEDMICEGLTGRQDQNLATAVFCPEDDICFLGTEYHRLFGTLACQGLLHVIPGTHAPMTCQIGQEQAAQVGGWFADVYHGRVPTSG
jgi:hypothetical protein